MIERESEFESNDFEEIFALAGDLEEIACRYDEAYANGENGLFSLVKKTEDNKGKVTTTTVMQAQRIYSGDAQFLTQYEVTLASRHNGLSMQSFPEDIWQLLCQDRMNDLSDEDADEPEYVVDEEWLEELGDDETEFAIEFFNSHVITDDGAIITCHEMRAYVNDEMVQLPEARLIDAGYVPEIEVSDVEESLDDFVNLFSPEDLIAFHDIGSVVLQDFQADNAVVRLYAEIESVRFMSYEAKLRTMRETAARLFPELLKDI